MCDRLVILVFIPKYGIACVEGVCVWGGGSQE